MKKYIIYIGLLFSFCGCSKEVIEEYQGDIVIRTKEDLKDYPNLSKIRKIDGSLTLMPDDILKEDMYSFKGLVEITGDLKIDGEHVRDFILQSIETVGGSVDLDMDISTYLDFSSIRSIGSTLKVRKGYDRRDEFAYDFSGLESVSVIDISTNVDKLIFSDKLTEVDVFLIDDDFTHEISGLENLEVVNDSLFIDASLVLKGGAFQNLRVVKNSLYLNTYRFMEPSFDWLSNLEECSSISIKSYHLYPYDLCKLVPFINNNPDTDYFFDSVVIDSFGGDFVLQHCQ